MKDAALRILCLFCAGVTAVFGPGESGARAEPLKLQLVLDAGKTFQTIDGFGVNFNPAQWRNGTLKSAIDLLVDDLGCTMIRFDPTGLAEWLDPARRNPDGSWPDAYLKEIYTSPIFRDAWAAFRALNAKGIEPFFNVSGRIAAGLGRPENPRRLADFQGYAEMLVSMLEWARRQEGLRFHCLSPFNETDYGYPEGPRLEVEDLILATQALIKKLDSHGLVDVQLVLADDAEPVMARFEAILNHPEWHNRVRAFGLHTYGDGDEFDAVGWQGGVSPHGQILNRVRASPFAQSPLWMTEYGDLDLSGIIEQEIGWRSTRRLLKFINEGYSAGLIWDAFDNLHKHDGAWSDYGILATDTNRWTYTPKPRYYAAKQMFRFVRPGFVRIAVRPVRPARNADPYVGARDPFRHLLLSAFASPDREGFTLVGMNRSERDLSLTVTLKGFDAKCGIKRVQVYETAGQRNCRPGDETGLARQPFTANVRAKSVFTLTTLYTNP